MRNKMSGREPFVYIGDKLGRTAQACRVVYCNLLKEYTAKGYFETFNEHRPAGLGEPNENKPVVRAAKKATATGAPEKKKVAKPVGARVGGIMAANRREEEIARYHQRAMFRDAAGYR